MRPADRILAALADLDVDRPRTMAAFAEAILRRIDDLELEATAPEAVARRISELFEWMAALERGDHQVTVSRPDTGLDGRRPGPTTVGLICEDRPFLLSTVTDELTRQGHRILRMWHPIVGIDHDRDQIPEVVPARSATYRVLVLHIEVDPSPSGESITATANRIDELVEDVMRATDDFEAMNERLAELAAELRFGAWTDAEIPEANEVADLIDWMLDDNLVLLGIREYALADHDDGPALRVVEGSGLGLLHDESTSRYATPVPIGELASSDRARFADDRLLTVGRTRSSSPVQRRDRMQYFRLLRRAETVTEIRILGLFTRKALSEPAASIPVLRTKLRDILEREDVVDGSHDEVAITSLFEAVPKDELFHATGDELHTMVVGLLKGEERDEVRTLVRHDPESVSVSVMVAVPRDRYGPQLRQRLQDHLAARFSAKRVDVDLSLGDRPDALARFLLHLDTPAPDVSGPQLRDEIRQLARSWIDDLREHIGDDPDRRALADRLPAGYRDTIDPGNAVRDVDLLARLATARENVVVEVRAGTEGDVRIRVGKSGGAIELSSFMPVLESLGLVVVEEVPHLLPDAEEPLHLHDFGVRADDLDPERDGDRAARAILAAWRGHLSVDPLNALVLAADLEWHDVIVLRAYRRLRRQLGTNFTSEYINQTLVTNADVVGKLVEYFDARFDPDLAADDAQREAARTAAIDACDALERLDHDRILRGFTELIDATVRTNAFRTDARADDSGEPYVAFKIDPSRIQGVAQPVAHREIFVHSPRVEGVHLRFGPVARGGLRWSDRRDDVRAEVFDLVKAQVLKNALIVPTGAKGGFVVRDEPEDPARLREEARRQYVTFVRGMLDVTDDLDGDTVVHPERVVCHDGPDPYLVVAADRGTATLSDTANAIARRYGFWLDDAFASGGSSGYDHKQLGVTARGTWIAVQRHFRELGIDVQSEPVTMVGIGDMSGDVFGNGLLRSRTARLVAAFDHRHVFLDPDPDPERSFEERARLFDLEDSSWNDYDRSLISAGGGVFARDARSIPLSDQVRALLRVDADAMSPPELIRAILCAPVDLLFSGGIGTYIKASTQGHDEVGDRANTELRVDARDVRARVIGEGANLSITQAGRIEFARRGGRINQDAIDNAAGVATSDCEVNLKILLKVASDHGRLDDAERDTVMADLADEVVDLVMRMVDRQGAGVSRELARSPAQLDAYDRMMGRLEASHHLDREVEHLPSSAEILERAEAEAGLTRPEIATLVAWSKRELKESLLASEAIDAPLFDEAAADQFPAAVVERFGDLLQLHRLRRELIATAIANDVVDRLGITFVTRLVEVTGADLADVVTAHRVARQVTRASRLWAIVDEMESTHDTQRLRDIDDEIEHTLLAITAGLIDHPTLRSAPDDVARHLKEVADQLHRQLLDLGTHAQRRARMAHLQWLIDDLVEPELARFLAVARDLRMLPEVGDVVATLGHGQDATRVMEVFLHLGEQLGIDRLEDLLARAHSQGPWEARQHDGVADDLRLARHDAALTALREHRRDAPPREVASLFAAQRDEALERAGRVVNELDHRQPALLDAIAVAARMVGRAVRQPPSAEPAQSSPSSGAPSSSSSIASSS